MSLTDHLPRSYWHDVLLAGGPTAVPRWTVDPTPGVDVAWMPLPGALARSLRQRSAELGSPLEALVAAAHGRVLASLSGETDVVTGWIDGSVGEPLPCRLSTETASWRALIANADQAIGQLRAHRHFDVAGLRDELNLVGPSFEAELDLSGRDGLLDDGSVWRLSVAFDGPALRLGCHYRTEMIDAGAADRVLGYHRRALELLAADPLADHADESLLAPDELNYQLHRLAGPARELPDRRVHELFEQAVRDRPDAVAAVYGNQRWSYRELNSRANRIGRALLDRGVRAETVVAVVTERNLDWMAAVLAIFKAGGVYLPIEPQFPADRIARSLNRADCRLVVAEGGSTDNLTDACQALDRMEVLLIGEAYDECRDDDNLDVAVGQDQLAYIYFTSGSTGEPKGAMCEHAGMLNHLYAKIDDFGIDRGQVVAQVAPQCFDISLWQLLTALLVDGTTLIVEQDILLDPARFLDRVVGGDVSVLQVVPSYLEVLLSYLDQNPTDLGPLHCVSVTGEALSMELVERWFAAKPDIRLANAYGLTETSDDTNHEVMSRPPAGDRVPLGPAVNNVSVRVVDPMLQPVPLGAPGEIVFSGVCVGRGYINDPERTAMAFLADNLWEGQRLYRSGDFGRWRPDGKLEFLGRRDAQIKIRGFRIEIGDIENAMLGVPGVRQAAVVVVTRPDGDKQLVGFFTGDAADAEVRAGLVAALPGYMVPDVLHRREELPLTDNGKVDRKRLRLLAVELEARAEIEPPANSAEERLAAVWATVLGVPHDQVSRHDDFFDRGSSLTAVELVIALDGAITLKDVTTHPVLADLARCLDRDQADDDRATGLLHRLTASADGRAGTLVCFPYAGGNAVTFRAMADELGDSGLVVYAVELPGHDVFDEPLAPFEEVVAAAAGEVAALGASTLFLWGHSSGAAFALETARALEDVGVGVNRVFLAAQLPGRPQTRLGELAEPSDVELAAMLVDDVGHTGLANLDEERLRRVGAAFRHDWTEANQALCALLDQRPAAKLTAPVTVVLAADDPLTTGGSSRVSEWEPVANELDHLELTGGGHYFIRTRPAEAAAAVRQAASRSTSTT